MPANPVLPLLRVASGVIAAALTRRIGLRVQSGPVALTLRSAWVVPSLPGRFRSVQLVADDVTYRRVRLHNVHVVARDVRLGVTGIRAGSVRLHTALDQQMIDTLLAHQLSYAQLRLDTDDVIHAVLARRPHWGHAELFPQTTDGALVLSPRAFVTASGTRFTRVARLLPSLRLAPDRLLPDCHVTAASVRAGQLHLTVVAPDVHLPYP